MSEQKYYVKSKVWNGKENYFTLNKNLIKDPFWSRWINPKIFKVPQQQFTKSELAEIMDGALYRVCNKDETFGLSPHACDIEDVDCTEWINPLIELVPVEEEE